MDKVVIKNILAQGIIGIRDWERIQPQDILINIVIYTEERGLAALDNISECIDYSKVTKKGDSSMLRRLIGLRSRHLLKI